MNTEFHELYLGECEAVSGGSGYIMLGSGALQQPTSGEQDNEDGPLIGSGN